MNKFVTSALAITVAGSVAYAGTGDSEWLELDREITSLSSSLATAQGGMGWSALLRTTLTYSDDDIATGGTVGAPANDVFGWSFEDIDLAFWGEMEECGFRISMDATNATKLGTVGGNGPAFRLEDAYGWMRCGDMATALMGQHKANSMRSALVVPEGLLFPNRTVLGSAFDSWNPGVSSWGAVEMLRWSFSIQNGAGGSGGGQTSDHAYTARLEYDLGEGAGNSESALGAPDDLAATVGFTFRNDDTQTKLPGALGGSDTEFFALDAWGTMGQIGFGLEVASVGDDLALGTDEDFGRFSSNPAPSVATGTFSENGTSAGGATPWGLTLSFLLNEQIEFAGRYENMDNTFDTTVASLAVNYYQGPSCKWVFAFSDVAADPGNLGGATVTPREGSVWQVGFVVGNAGTGANPYSM